MATDGVTYLTEKIAHVGLNPEKIQKTFSIRPRQHGLNAFVKRVGKVIVSDVAQSDLRFAEQPLREHGFIHDHKVQTFTAVALRSRITGDTLGVMYMNYCKAHGFTRQQEALAVELADIAALAINTARGSEEMTYHHRTQEVNRLRYVLEAALSPDADDTKAISALLANTAELLSIANYVELMVLEWADGQLVLDGTWRVYHSHRAGPPSRSIQTISDRGIAQQAFIEKRLLSIPDLQQSGLPSSVYGDNEAVFSALAAPVYHSKQVVGVLLAASNCAHAFNQRDEVRLAELASAAGLVIGNLRRRQGLLSAVLKAAEGVTQPSSIQGTLQAVVDQARKAAPELDCVTLWSCKPGSNELVAGPQWGLEYSASREGATTQSDLVRSVIADSKPIWASDALNVPIFSCSDFIKNEKIVSTVAFPLRVDDKSVGALFFNYRQRHEFTSEERDAFPIFAAIAAASIRDALLLEIAQRGEARLLAALEVVKAAGALGSAIRCCELFSSPCAIISGDMSPTHHHTCCSTTQTIRPSSYRKRPGSSTLPQPGFLSRSGCPLMRHELLRR